MTKFQILNPDGTTIDLGEISQADMLKCPFCIIDFEHYRPGDGTCRCDDPEEQKRMISEWGYTPEDIQAGLIRAGRGK